MLKTDARLMQAKNDSELQYKATNFVQGWCKQRMSLKQWENMCKKEKEKASLELAIASLWVQV